MQESWRNKLDHAWAVDACRVLETAASLSAMCKRREPHQPSSTDRSATAL